MPDGAAGLCLAVTVMMQANRLSCLLHQEKQQHLREVELQDQQQHAHTLAEYAIKHASMVNRQIEHVQQANAELSWNNSELNTRIQKANNLLVSTTAVARLCVAALRLLCSSLFHHMRSIIITLSSMLLLHKML